jgi:hypothetical protein
MVATWAVAGVEIRVAATDAATVSQLRHGSA